MSTPRACISTVSQLTSCAGTPSQRKFITTYKDPVFYRYLNDSNVPHIVDTAKLLQKPNTPVDCDQSGEPPVYVSFWSGQTMEQMAQQYTGLQIGEMDDFIATRETELTSQPELITQEQFWEALECMPPNDWHNLGNTESFMCCEHLCGRITAIYVRIGENHYSFNDLCTRTHKEIINKVKASVPPITEPVND